MIATHVHVALVEVVPIADLAAIVVCLLTLLVAAAGQQIINWAIKLIPKISLLGVEPLSPLVELLEGAEQRFVELYDGAGYALNELIKGLAWLAKILGKDVDELMIKVFDNLDHIAGTLLPNDRHGLEGQIGRTRERIEGRLGAEIKTAQAKGEDAQAHLHELRDALGPIPAGGFEAEIGNSVARGVTESEQYTHKADKAITEHLQEHLKEVWRAVDALQHSVAVEVPAEIRRAIETEPGNPDERIAKLRGELYERTASLSGRLAGVEADVSSLQGELSAVRRQITSLDSSTAEGREQLTVLQGQERTLETRLAPLQQQTSRIEREIAEANGELGKLKATETLRLPAVGETGVPSSITIPVAVGALGAAIGGIINRMDECVVEQCGSGPKQIENVLKRLLGLTGDLAAFGMLAEAIAKPVGTADTLQPLFDTVDTGAQEAWRAILELV